MFTQQLTKPQTNITFYTYFLRNIILIISAFIAFSLWLSSTISMPKRLEKLEEQTSLINIRQKVLEEKTALIYSEVKETKNLLSEKLNK